MAAGTGYHKKVAARIPITRVTGPRTNLFSSRFLEAVLVIEEFRHAIENQDKDKNAADLHFCLSHQERKDCTAQVN